MLVDIEESIKHVFVAIEGARGQNFNKFCVFQELLANLENILKGINAFHKDFSFLNDNLKAHLFARFVLLLKLVILIFQDYFGMNVLDIVLDQTWKSIAGSRNEMKPLLHNQRMSRKA